MHPTPDPAAAAALTARGAAALRSGDKAGARALLAAAIRTDPTSPQSWLWLSGVVETAAEQRFCLERAAALDPQLAAAQRGLAALRGVTPTSPTLPGPSASPAAAPQPALAQHLLPASQAAPPVVEAYLNPWVWIWARPRQSLRFAIRGRSSVETVALGALAGTSALFGAAALRRLGAEVPPGSLLLLVLLAGPPFGLGALLLSGVLLRIAGRWLGGRGGASAVRAALAWAGAPLALGLPIWGLQLALLPAASFGSQAGAGAGALIAALLRAAHGVLYVWAALLAALGVAEAHEISPLRGALSWLVAAGILVAGAALVLGGAALIIGLRGG